MPTLNLGSLIAKQQTREKERRALHLDASAALSAAKRATFAGQRDDVSAGARELAVMRDAIAKGEKICRRDPGLAQDGQWRAALEESCEAVFVYEYLAKGSINIKNAPSNDPEILLGGLADFTGELARYAVLAATNGDKKLVEKLYRVARDVVEKLLALDLTGSLRTKFDQSKQHLRKLEDVRYDLSRRV